MTLIASFPLSRDFFATFCVLVFAYSRGGGESFVQHLIVRHGLLLDGKIMYLKPKCTLKGIEILRNKHQVHLSDVKRVTMTWK